MNKAVLYVYFFFSFLNAKSMNSNYWVELYGASKKEGANSIVRTRDSGFVMVGYSESYGNGGSDIWVVHLNNEMELVWQNFFGGSRDDRGHKIIKAHDGGYLILGVGYSSGSTNSDIWLIKIDSLGQKLWKKTYGDQNTDLSLSLEKITNGGYLITGNVYPSDFGMQDGFVLKVDNKGRTKWNKKFGGKYQDGLFSAIETQDSSFLAVGFTNSIKNSGMKKPNKSFFNWFKKKFSKDIPSQEIWLLKLDELGEMIWQKTYGGKGVDIGFSIHQSKDKGYLITGTTTSFGRGLHDIWMIKTDSKGQELWNNTYGRKQNEMVNSIYQNQNESFIISSSTNSIGNPFFGKQKHSNVMLKGIDYFGDETWEKLIKDKNENKINQIVNYGHNQFYLVGEKVPKLNQELSWLDKLFNNGPQDYPFQKTSQDAWIIESDSVGNIKEEITLGDFGNESGYSISKTKDLGYLIIGQTDIGNHGENDILVLKYSQSGKREWSNNFGGSENDYGRSILERMDGNFFSISESYSGVEGGADLLVQVISNKGNLLWENIYGSINNDIGKDAIELENGNIIIVGHTNSYGNGATDAWIFELDQSGNEVWGEAFGGMNFDYASSIDLTSSGDYIISGTTASNGNGENDIWLINYNKEGYINWQQYYGGPKNESGVMAKETKDKGFIIIGSYLSKKPSENNDVYVVKTDSVGNKKWSQIIGGKKNETAHSICVSKDGSGFFITGETKSIGKGNGDIWVVKLDNRGFILWEKSFGGSSYDCAYDIHDDGDGIVLTGQSDLNENGFSDLIFMKIDYDGLALDY